MEYTLQRYDETEDLENILGEVKIQNDTTLSSLVEKYRKAIITSTVTSSVTSVITMYLLHYSFP